MKHRFLLALIVGFFISCSSQETKKEAILNIIAYITDKEAYPMPPPPPEVSDTLGELSQLQIDSLMEIDLNIAVYPIFEAIDQTAIPVKLDDDCGDLIDDSHDEDVMEIPSFTTPNGHWIAVSDSKNILDNKEYKNFNILLRFSKFYFNKDYTKAVFTVGVSSSQLAGHGSIYCLEQNEDGSWRTLYTEMFEQY